LYFYPHHLGTRGQLYYFSTARGHCSTGCGGLISPGIGPGLGGWVEDTILYDHFVIQEIFFYEVLLDALLQQVNNNCLSVL
jgi:hypothetical protein